MMYTLIQTLTSTAEVAGADYIQPTRNFSLAYVILDSIFVIAFMVLLFIQKKKMTFLFALAGGILYFLVDYLIFYVLTGSREIFYLVSGAEEYQLCNSFQTALVLFWMSMSYGIMDFAFIWLWLSKDKKALEYTGLIVIWWICCPLIADFFNNIFPSVMKLQTTRSTGKYHGVMGIIMAVGYIMILVMNIINKDKKEKQIPIVRLFIIGFMAQFLWELLLFVFGIRSQTYDNDVTRIITTIMVNSLVETNLGMPYLYFIHKGLMSKFNEELSFERKETVLENK